MEQNPNLLNQGQTSLSPIERSMVPSAFDTPLERVAKRRTLHQWYEMRRLAARERYRRWISRRSLERRAGTADITMLGHYVMNRVVDERYRKPQQKRRLMRAMRHWQEFLRRNSSDSPPGYRYRPQRLQWRSRP